jgi:hypothetical protein
VLLKYKIKEYNPPTHNFNVAIVVCSYAFRLLSSKDLTFIVYHDKFLIIKPTRCTDFSNWFLDWNCTCFEQILCPSSGIFHRIHSNAICHTGLLTAWEQDQDVPLLCVQWKTPDDGQRNCPKHVQFHSKNKLEKSVHLVGFVIKNLFKGFILKLSDHIILA